MPFHTRAPLALTVALLVAGLACGGGDSNGVPPSGRKTVLVANNEFQPLLVTISAGDTILWSWTSNSSMHNILSTGSPSFTSLGTAASPGVLDVDYFNAPKSYQVIFNAAGTYEYFCSQHGVPGGNMHGTVQVNP